MTPFGSGRSERAALRVSARTLAVVSALSLTLANLTPAGAVSGASMTRLRGTVGFSLTPNGTKHDVVTSAGVPDGAEIYTLCSSMTQFSVQSANLVLGAGGNVDISNGGSALALNSGAMRVDAAGPSPIYVTTPVGKVAISSGGGYVITGSGGSEIIATSGPGFTYAANGTMVVVPVGRALIANAASATPQLVDIATVNNPALYQFAAGNNPLRTHAAAHDPAGSPPFDCFPQAAGTGISLAALGLGLLGAGAAVAGGLGGGGGSNGGGGNGGGGNGGGGNGGNGGNGGTPAGTPTPSPAPGAPGAITLNPNPILLTTGIASPTSAMFTITQVNYTGPFNIGQPQCPIAVTGQPAASLNGNVVTVNFPAQLANLAVGCTVLVTGGGGQTATETLDLVVGALSPTPSPTNSSGGVVPLSANPSSILLLPAVNQPAVANIVVSPSSEGPFTASISCTIPPGTPPTVSVSGNVVTVTIAGQLISASVGCAVIITSPSTKQSVSVPVTIAATVAGVPTPTPAPGATAGPLTANPPSILLLPGITQNAQANIVLSDPGYIGVYHATSSCLLNASPPVVTINGNVLNVSYPATLINLALVCTITVTTTIGQSLGIPVTVSATVLGSGVPVGPASARTPSIIGMRSPGGAAPSALAFQPPALSIDSTSPSSALSVVYGAGPYRTTMACPAGTNVQSIVNAARVTLNVLTRGATDATCRLSVFGSNGSFGDVPVTVAAAGAPHVVNLPVVQRIGAEPAAGPQFQTLVLGVGEHRTLALPGFGARSFAGCANVADVRGAGDSLDVAGKSGGSCIETLTGATGSQRTVFIVVRVTRALAPVVTAPAGPAAPAVHPLAVKPGVPVSPLVQTVKHAL